MVGMVSAVATIRTGASVAIVKGSILLFARPEVMCYWAATLLSSK